jgi:hypothetical protein
LFLSLLYNEKKKYLYHSLGLLAAGQKVDSPGQNVDSKSAKSGFPGYGK